METLRLIRSYLLRELEFALRARGVLTFHLEPDTEVDSQGMAGNCASIALVVGRVQRRPRTLRLELSLAHGGAISMSCGVARHSQQGACDDDLLDLAVEVIHDTM